ncbi:hypothetical protein [Leuconostoc mesenteroides]|uniref:Uncharacterized protein n=2 Tax=Leuconostoc mesenteroides TaxID=1245 RepID=C2KHG4_LEUMC|nr:hypothetical protein [Leuconostoc mesenteroides]EQC82998.1 hypothetical protein LMT8_03705 [Leuconostoc mesenteroides subsp. cremoris TIFN8]KDA52223.1 hypothetical protein L963_442 [Leuconostoc mesenteroides subsp. cremoris T26]EEJ43296.1 hypothetical protein HMPREF0555_0080 [Leuconostoc mesenteroides subsp. cremoris ATCC 19254]MDG9750990.1 hypothetical protein [Leuconostoc mesenteroides]ORI37372.1 hypothetical protein BMR90_05485 [Leuconostoc mesenteroides subsp. cremoris]
MLKTKSLLIAIIIVVVFGGVAILLREFTTGADYTVVNKDDEKKFYQVHHKTDVSDKILQFKINDKVLKGDSILLNLPENNNKKVSILVDNNHIDRIFKVGDIITVKLSRSVKIRDNFYVVSADIK